MDNTTARHHGSKPRKFIRSRTPAKVRPPHFHFSCGHIVRAFFICRFFLGFIFFVLMAAASIYPFPLLPSFLPAFLSFSLYFFCLFIYVLMIGTGKTLYFFCLYLTAFQFIIKFNKLFLSFCLTLRFRCIYICVTN